jgi:hypothetical protein
VSLASSKSRSTWRSWTGSSANRPRSKRRDELGTSAEGLESLSLREMVRWLIDLTPCDKGLMTCVVLVAVADGADARPGRLGRAITRPGGLHELSRALQNIAKNSCCGCDIL